MNRTTKRELAGLKFGKLTVIKETEKKKVGKQLRIAWLCNCECGNKSVVITGPLVSGFTKSCGCLKGARGKNHIRWKGYEKIRGSMMYRIEQDAKDRNLEFNITAKQLWDKFNQQSGICAISKVKIRLPISYDADKNYMYSASLDRIDSGKGYTIDNVQWVHKVVNKIKQELSENDFLNWCTIIVEANKEKQCLQN
jgi:hypothetical protein